MTAGEHVKKVFARNRRPGTRWRDSQRQGRGEGMKKLLVLLAAMLAAVAATAPAGFLIDGYCVKAGSSNQGDGPVMVPVNPPQATVTISYPGGKAVSHY